jgi:hypothetical protein
VPRRPAGSPRAPRRRHLEIQGRRLRFPVRIRHARAACATYAVGTERARGLVAGTGLELVSVAGRTPLFLALVDYRDRRPRRLRRGGRRVPGPPPRPHRALHPPAAGDADLHDGGRAGPVGPAEVARRGRAGDRRAGRPLPPRRRRRAARPHRRAAGAVAAACRAGWAARSPRSRPIRAASTPPPCAPGWAACGSAGGGAGARHGHPMAEELRALDLPRRPLAVVTADRVAFEMDAALDVPA